MNPTIKAIQTEYKGYHFRSRLEARWAVFFDQMGYTWEYEKEGFNLGEKGFYLPDFYIHGEQGRQAVYVEVKPIEGVDDGKAQAFHDLTENAVMLVTGVPEPKGYPGLYGVDNAFGGGATPNLQDVFYHFDVFVHAGKRHAPVFWSTEEFDPHFSTDGDLLWACYQAKSARFEHGQKGATQ